MVSGGETRVISSKGVSHGLDLREVDCDQAASSADELEDIVVSDIDAERCLKLAKGISLEVKSQVIGFLKANLDVFSWNHEDMVGIDLNKMLHRLNIDSNHKLVHQKSRPMTVSIMRP